MLEPPLSIRTTSVGHQHLRYGSNGLLPGTPKRKRESSCSRPGPADASRGAKPMEPPNENSARTQKRHTHQTSTAGTSHQRREGGIGRGPPDPWIVSWSEGPHSGCPGGTPRSPLPTLVGVLRRQECREPAPRQRKPAAQEQQCQPVGRETTGGAPFLRI